MKMLQIVQYNLYLPPVIRISHTHNSLLLASSDFLVMVFQIIAVLKSLIRATREKTIE